MPLTRNFVDTVQERAQREPAFRAALFEEALQALLDGDHEGAKALLRYCINATASFQTVSDRAGLSVKSVMRMVGPNGNPTLDNLVSVLRAIQEEAHLQATVSVLAQ